MAAKRLPYYDYSIISADNLLHGGLLAARQNIAAGGEKDALLRNLQQLPTPTKGQQDIFSVIPRLLVSDQLLPDRWYQYQLWRYSQLADLVRITGSFDLTRQMREAEAQIPSKVLDKYRLRYQQSDHFNLSLLQLATHARHIIIGQDDAAPLACHTPVLTDCWQPSTDCLQVRHKSPVVQTKSPPCCSHVTICTALAIDPRFTCCTQARLQPGRICPTCPQVQAVLYAASCSFWTYRRQARQTRLTSSATSAAVVTILSRQSAGGRAGSTPGARAQSSAS